MVKEKPVTLEISDVLRHLGLDLQQFLLSKEAHSKKTLQGKKGKTPPHS